MILTNIFRMIPDTTNQTMLQKRSLSREGTARTLRFFQDDEKRLKQVAHAKGMYVSEAIRLAVNEWVEKHGGSISG